MVARGHSVTVLTGLPNYPEGRLPVEFKRAPERYVDYCGVEIVRVPLIPRGSRKIQLVLNYASFAISASTLGLWRLRDRQFDAIFVYEPSPVTVGLPAVALRAVKKTPVAFWVLDLWPETLRAVGVVRSEALLRAVGWLVSFIYDRCDLVLAQSRSFIPEIRRYLRRPNPVEYFPSWAEAVFDGQENVAAATELPSKNGHFDVMFAGNIGEAQDFPSILEAARLLRAERHIRWLIVGDGRLSAWVAHEIDRLDLKNQVVMLGRHPIERMPSFYKGADALLVSLKSDPIFAMTIPGKLQTYLAAGVPVVAMLNGEGADVVRRSSSGVTCASGDAQGLAAAVLSLSRETPERLLGMRKNALAASAQEFGRDTLMQRLEGWLQNMPRTGF